MSQNRVYLIFVDRGERSPVLMSRYYYYSLHQLLDEKWDRLEAAPSAQAMAEVILADQSNWEVFDLPFMEEDVAALDGDIYAWAERHYKSSGDRYLIADVRAEIFHDTEPRFHEQRHYRDFWKYYADREDEVAWEDDYRKWDGQTPRPRAVPPCRGAKRTAILLRRHYLEYDRWEILYRKFGPITGGDA